MPFPFLLIFFVVHIFYPLFTEDFWIQVSNEEAKSIEISKLQKLLESLKLELDAAKLATINECNKNAVLQNQLELSMKEKSAIERELVAMADFRKENALLKVCFILLINFLFVLSITNKRMLD